MSFLVQMRQRIRAIETIKKITHAMRLISMSSHAQLNNKKTTLKEYFEHLQNLFFEIREVVPQWHPSLGRTSGKNRKLIILVGSQKGLCGNFNNALFSFFQKEIADIPQDSMEIITIGKKAHDYAQNNFKNIIMHFDEFSASKLVPIVKKIIEHILEAKPNYTSVDVFSNFSKTFFVQKSTRTNLIPFSPPVKETKKMDAQIKEKEPYMWQENPEKILNFLANRLLDVTLHTILLESLVAEQAARFIAMDNSTRNAKDLLGTMKLEYNKLRQANITRELTDLIGSF